MAIVTRRTGSRSGAAAALPPFVLCATFLFVPAGFAAAPALRGFTPCAWNSPDCSPCVADAVDSVRRLRDHGDILGILLLRRHPMDTTFNLRPGGVPRSMLPLVGQAVNA